MGAIKIQEVRRQRQFHTDPNSVKENPREQGQILQLLSMNGRYGCLSKQGNMVAKRPAISDILVTKYICSRMQAGRQLCTVI